MQELLVATFPYFLIEMGIRNKELVPIPSFFTETGISLVYNKKLDPLFLFPYCDLNKEKTCFSFPVSLLKLE